MSILQYGIRFCCDSCQATADSPRPQPGPLRWDDIPVPDGWTALQPMLSLTFKDGYGAMINHLCAVCSMLPVGELAAKLKEAASRTQVGLLWPAATRTATPPTAAPGTSWAATTGPSTPGA